MKTCKVKATITIGGVVTASKEWPTCDALNTGRTKAWARGQFNKAMLDMSRCVAGINKTVRMDWRADYPDGFYTSGRIAGVNGEVYVKRGVFEGKK